MNKILQLEVGNYVYLEVSDTGNGMDKETIGKIFDPFYSTKDAGKGTGLGLSISRTIAKSHQARLFVDSAADNTTFIFEIPIERTLEYRP